MKEVGAFLQRLSNDQPHLTDFTLHSIGIILLKLQKPETLSRFVQNGAVRLVGLQPSDMTSLIDTARKYKLDFDDAYQYTASRPDTKDLLVLSAPRRQTRCT